MDLLLCRLVCNLQVSVSPAFSRASPHQQKHSTPSLRLSFHCSRWSPACFVDVLSCVRRLLAPTFTLHGLWVRMPACLRNWNVFAQQKKNTGGLCSPAIRSPSSERHSGPNDGKHFWVLLHLGRAVDALRETSRRPEDGDSKECSCSRILSASTDGRGGGHGWPRPPGPVLYRYNHCGSRANLVYM